MAQNYLFIAISFYRNIFLSQYREQKYLVCIGPSSVDLCSKHVIWHQKSGFSLEQSLTVAFKHDKGMRNEKREREMQMLHFSFI